MTDLVPNEEDENGPYWDPWTALGLRCAGYSGAIDAQAVAVLGGISYKEFCTDIAEASGMSPEHVELWQYIFCSAGWAEYGTSPRACFPNHGGPDISALIDGWKTYYERHWGQPFPEDG